MSLFKHALSRFMIYCYYRGGYPDPHRRSCAACRAVLIDSLQVSTLTQIGQFQAFSVNSGELLVQDVLRHVTVAVGFLRFHVLSPTPTKFLPGISPPKP
jgi:hypothetical protein